MITNRYIENYLSPLKKRRKFSNPAVFVISAYLLLIIVGTVLLNLPIAEKIPIAFADNFFIATSAVCVTGLASIDIGSSYTYFGHWVIIFLMQIGGLGVMVFSTTLILFAGMRPGFNYMNVFHEEFSHQGLISPGNVLKAILPFTLVMEGLGFVVFLWQLNESSLYERIFSALFHSVSLFCNVGYALYPDSLMQFEKNPIVVITSCALVIAGGFGFLAAMELPNIFKRKKRLSLHTKLALTFTVSLLAIITAAFCALEFNNSLANESMLQKILSSFSYSTMCRTAGINFTSLGTITNGTMMITMIGMFIGANPGSCGGGIKTTTFAVVVFLAINRLRGRNRIQAFGRTIPQDVVNKSVYLFVIAVVVIMTSTLLLLLTETGTHPYTEASAMFKSEGISMPFSQVLFEVVSAYTTCGLSLGITPELSGMGHYIICFVMFIGRMGPLFLISSVIKKDEGYQAWPSEENIMIG